MSVENYHLSTGEGGVSTNLDVDNSDEATLMPIKGNFILLIDLYPFETNIFFQSTVENVSNE